MNKKMKKQIIIIITSIVLLIIAFLINDKLSVVFFLLSYIIVGHKIIYKAFRNIIRGKVFDENFLMTIATLGAFFINEIPEAVTVMLFYQIGEFFQDYALDKSRKSISSLMDIRPDYANVVKGKDTVKVNPSEVKIGDIIVVKSGEKIPLDGIVESGDSALNTSALTGESKLRKVDIGDEVLSGSINISGILKIKVTKEFSESTVSKILELVENASNRKSESENFITKFARYYTPIVVIEAILLSVIPPVIFNQDFNTWIYRALSFLVVSCPCALVVSIPLGFFSGIGACSKNGILVKGSNYLEAISKSEIVVFDKTGTITEGEFKVRSIHSVDIRDNELLKLASYAEYYSNHPISISIKKDYGHKINPNKISDVKEIPGRGVIALVDNKKVMVGNNKLLEENNIEYEKCDIIGTIIYVAVDNVYHGYMVISDRIKDDSALALRLLKNLGVKKTVMLTGDKDDVSKNVFERLNINEYYSELLPQEKVNIINEFKKKLTDDGKIVFAGDGINDAPVIMSADIGISMGGVGSDAAIEASDIVIMTDELSKIATVINISKSTMKIVKQNIVFAISVKIFVLLLISFGILTMWSAVFADVGVSVLAILNSIRILKIKY